jgi:hypothetical protein
MAVSPINESSSATRSSAAYISSNKSEALLSLQPSSDFIFAAEGAKYHFNAIKLAVRSFRYGQAGSSKNELARQKSLSRLLKHAATI